MDIGDVSRKCSEGLSVDLQVSPNSSRSGVEGIDPWRKRLIICVRSPPLDGRANKEVEEVIFELTGHKAKVVGGFTSRQKSVVIYGECEDTCRKLKELI